MNDYREIIHTDNAPKSIGPYNQAVLVDKTLYISGQLPIDVNTGSIVSPDIAEQTRQSLKNIEAILKEAEMTLSNIVKVTIFMQNLEDFAKMNEIYGAFFKGNYPARSTVEVAKVPKGALLEIEAVAFRNL